MKTKIFKKILIFILFLMMLSSCGEENIVFDIKCSETTMEVSMTTNIYVTTNVDITVNNLTPQILEIVATQSDAITVKAIEAGIGEIEIQAKDEVKKVTITVIKKDIAIIPTSLNVRIKEEGPYYVGSTYHLDCNVEPSGALKNIYYNYNENNMIIDETKQEVTFLEAGIFKIACYSYDNMEIEQILEVDVEYNPDLEMYRILFVGNSLTKSVSNNNYSIPDIVSNMIKADGVPVLCEMNVAGGASLMDQKQKVANYLNKNRYTHVVLQEQSAGPILHFDKFEKAVLDISKMVKTNKAKLVLYQTWAYNVNYWNGMTKKEMQLALVEAYENVGKQVGASINPAGLAFERYEAQNDDLPSLYYDMNHPSTYGAYLSACVHYASITGRKSDDNTYMMPGIENEIAEIIQKIADEVVFNN